MESLRNKSSQLEIAVISLVNFRNYVGGYMSEQEVMNASFMVPLESVPVTKK